MLNKVIWILRPSNKKGSPSYERVKAFSEFFNSKGFEVLYFDYPAGIWAQILLFKEALRTRPDYIFISMPPFRLWIFLIFRSLKVIVDIRDGWSIAMLSGYGGNIKPKRLQGKVAQLIEYFALKRAYSVLTVTPGLKKYLEKLTGREILLVRNGISRHRLNIAKQYYIRNRFDDSVSQRVFVCTGQFSEYGKDKVIKIIEKINERYGDKKSIIRLIGSDKNKNEWIADFLDANVEYKNIRLEIVDRVDESKLYKLLSQAFCGLVVIRDPDYDFGTKIYDYISIGLPYLNYFDEENNFTTFFSKYSDNEYCGECDDLRVNRDDIIEDAFKYFFTQRADG